MSTLGWSGSIRVVLPSGGFELGQVGGVGEVEGQPKKEPPPSLVKLTS